MTIDAEALPRIELPAGSQLYRIHKAARGSWHFAAHDKGRFNPCAAPGRGTCYWSTEPLGAFVIADGHDERVLEAARRDAAAVGR